MKYFFLGALLVLSIQACTSTADKSGKADSTLVDSIAGIAEDLSDSAATIPTHFYEINDSTIKLTSSRALSPKEVRSLFYPLKETGDKLNDKVFRCLQLDSIAKGKKPSDFDLGELVKVKISFIDTLYANTDYTLCSWKMDASSYEACPYWSGTLIGITSFDSNGKQISSACVAENSSGGDPPVWGSDFQSAKIFSDGKIEIYLETKYGEDEEGEKIISKQMGKISSEGLISMDAPKEISKEKIKEGNAE